MRRPTTEFLKTEAGSGVILGSAALAAVLAANSNLAWAYFAFIRAPFTIQFGAFRETATVLDWIKHGLMAVFFFVVGLEIKFEILKGELANPRRLALPILAAVGGMVVPALFYVALNAGQPPIAGAWATPTATDIAFALAALAVASKRLPPSLRIFLLTLAIVDDIGAVGLIAWLFSHEIRLWPLAGAAATLAAMAALSRWRSAPFLAYAVGFLLVWGFTLKSGVSTSVAGVLAAMTVPAGPHRRAKDGMLQQTMESLHPYVAYAILPLFAFTAAGFSFEGVSPGLIRQPIPLGIFAGLLLGKPIGVFGAAFAAAVLGLGRKPTGANWLEVLGVSLLCGVGFTMSLFIGDLAFPEDMQSQTQVRLGVALGSLLSGLAGIALLRWCGSRRPEAEDETMP
jgi:NhaA family Na+:H+ antiporter